jgi:hypothetical protein
LKLTLHQVTPALPPGCIQGSSSESPFFIEGEIMWKIAVGFAAFAGLALYILSNGGDIDMGGEKHGDTSHTEAASAPVKAASNTP